MTTKAKQITITIVLIAIAIIAITAAGSRKDESLANETGMIVYEYVNFREAPKTTADVIGKLWAGDTVEYTGNIREYFGGEGDSTDLWVEVTTPEGFTGWIVKSAVQKSVS